MREPRRLLLTGVCAVALLSALAGACDEDTPSDVGEPGAVPAPTPAQVTEVDDPYFPGVGDDRYDVRSYDLAAHATIAGTDHLDATMTLTAVARTDLDELSLDLDGFDVGEVTIDGLPAAARRGDATLVLTPAAPLASGTTFTVVVPYSGTPGGAVHDPDRRLEEGGGWVDLGASSAVLAQPIGARTWIPVNDLPSDKATVRVAVTVPSPLSAVSNGRLVERTDDPATGTSTFVWAAAEPMAPYLITLAVGEYRLLERAPVGSTTVLDAAPPDEVDLADAAFAPFAEMLTWFSGRFGPYPFADAGNVVVADLPPTAFESQTRSIFSDDTLDDDGTEELVAHELAHQWFGNAVTPRTWSDLWLNEGPAVHAQWSWTEHAGGASVLESALESWDPDDPDLDVPPAAPGVAQLFGTSVYVRSALFLVELQLLMGDEPFDRLLRTWVAEHRFGNADTEQFVALASQVHGSSIEELSDPWLHGDELPELSFDESDLPG